MKFELGYYKMMIKGGYFGTSYHYMRVYMNGKKKLIQIDHGIPQEADRCEEDIIHQYTLVKKIVKPIEINQLLVTVRWKDEDGHEFKLGAKNSYVLDRIFEMFPRLKKMFDV